MNVPEQVGIMTLPNAVLFPGAVLPLYIFEERYRRMLADCLEGERMFAVGLAQSPETTEGRGPLPHEIAGVGLVRTCVGQADGTSQLTLQGLTRVRILKYLEQHPERGYPVARVTPLDSVGTNMPGQRQSLDGMIRKLARARKKLGVGLPKKAIDSLLTLSNPALFADVVSDALVDDWQDKQALLETLDVGERLARLVDLLQEQIERFDLWKSLQGKLSNRDVGNN